MADTILVDGKTYHHHSAMNPAGGAASPLQFESVDRQRFFKKKKKLPLNNTAGAFFRAGGRNILIVIDKNTVPFGSGEWGLIAETAAFLEDRYAQLSDQGKLALSFLKAIIFSKRMARSYADVAPDLFFYDADELRRSDGSLNTPSWTASCIVHDANHIWQHDSGRDWTGGAAESECWRLQVENGAALGLSDIDIAHLNRFIADPSLIADRAGSGTFGAAAPAMLAAAPARARARPPRSCPPQPQMA